MRQFLWLGSFMDDMTNQVMTIKGYKNAASYLSQKNLLEGLETVTGIVFDSISAVAMAGYPRQGNIYIESVMFTHKAQAEDVLVGYFNPLYFNKLFMRSAMIKEVKRWIQNRYKGGDLDVYIYEMRSACLAAGAQIKKQIPLAKIHLIVPDLPCFMDLNMSRVKKFLKKIDWGIITSYFEYIDDFFLYTETMAGFLGMQDKKWMVVEGSINIKDIQTITTQCRENNKPQNEKKVIMYSGWIDKSFGIDKLIDSLSYLDNTYELWITGVGPYENELKRIASNDKRIKYYGFISKREELLQLQTNASIMLNIRDPQIEAAHYCFPSKLFEYMLLGIPVLTVNLRGIPTEYKQFLYEIDVFNSKQIAHSIQKVMNDPRRFEKAIAGKRFIIDEKNNLTVAKKIIRFLEE